MPSLRAVVDDVLVGAVGQVVAVLHRRHLEHPPRRLDLGHRHLAQAGVGDQALSRGSRRSRRTARRAEPWGRCGGAATGRSDRPSAGAGSSTRIAADIPGGPPAARRPDRYPGQPALGRDEQAIVGMQRLRDQVFADERDRSCRRCRRSRRRLPGSRLSTAMARGPIGRLAPDPRAGDPHRAEAKPIDRCDRRCANWPDWRASSVDMVALLRVKRPSLDARTPPFNRANDPVDPQRGRTYGALMRRWGSSRTGMNFLINGRAVDADVDLRTSLLDLLREHIGI